MPHLLAPAKINLRLKITGRRPDGYHLLDMVMVPLDLADEIEYEIEGAGIRIESDSSEVPTDSSNSLWKAVELIQEESGRRFGIRIFLKKNIPTAAGLGGGSSDAASLLKWLNEQLGLGWGPQRLIDLGVKIGADVPFFLTEGAQRVAGIGEILTPYPLNPLPLILINPGFPVSTKDVYRWWDASSVRPVRQVRPVGPLPQGLTPALVNGTGLALENDLETVVIPRYPVLARMKQSLVEAGALGALMSGSGPTVFGLFDSIASRDRGYEKLIRESDPRWWVWRGKSI